MSHKLDEQQGVNQTGVTIDKSTTCFSAIWKTWKSQ